MDRRDVARIERSLGFPLPEAYSALLLDFPKQLTDLYPANRSPDERRLFNTVKPIIATNSLVRSPSHLIDPDDLDSRWPDHFLIIGMDIGGNFYCLNRCLKQSAVFFWFHEDGEFEKYAKSLENFVEKLIRVYSKA